MQKRQAVTQAYYVFSTPRTVYPLVPSTELLVPLHSRMWFMTGVINVLASSRTSRESSAVSSNVRK